MNAWPSLGRWLVMVLDEPPHLCTRNLSAKSPVSQFSWSGVRASGKSKLIGEFLYFWANAVQNMYRSKSLSICPRVS